MWGNIEQIWLLFIIYLFFWRDDDVSYCCLVMMSYVSRRIANEMLWKFFFSWLKCVDRGVDAVEKKSKIWLMTGFSDSISSF